MKTKSPYLNSLSSRQVIDSALVAYHVQCEALRGLVKREFPDGAPVQVKTIYGSAIGFVQPTDEREVMPPQYVCVRFPKRSPAFIDVAFVTPINPRDSIFKKIQ